MALMTLMTLMSLVSLMSLMSLMALMTLVSLVALVNGANRSELLAMHWCCQPHSVSVEAQGPLAEGVGQRAGVCREP